MPFRWGYVQTRKRWHRVAINAQGHVKRDDPRCNLDDAKGRSRVVSVEPREGVRCLHCWDEDEDVGDEPPDKGRALAGPGSPAPDPRRRLAVPPLSAAAALLASLALGAAGGVVFSPDEEVARWQPYSGPSSVVWHVHWDGASLPGPSPSPSSSPSLTPTSSPASSPGSSAATPSAPPHRSPSPSSAAPTPTSEAARPTPCPHPGLHVGLDDPCRGRWGR